MRCASARGSRGPRSATPFLPGFRAHRRSGPRVQRSGPPATFARLVPVLVLAVACGGGDEAAHRGTAAAGQEPVPVDVARARLAEVPRTVQVTASVEPSRRVLPGTKIMGRVQAVPVAEGQAVSTGELLARIESRDLEAAMRQAEAGVASAEARLANARAQYERMVELHRRGSATAKSLEDATVAFRTAEAALEQARADVAAAGVTLEYAEVRSSLDGWVVAKEVEEGDVVQPGRALFTVEDLDPVKVVADVPEGEVTGIAPGDPVLVEVAATGYRAEGRVERIMPSGDRRSRTFRVKTLVPNEDAALKSGMFARVTLTPNGEGRRVLVVPRIAIVRRGQLEGVFVVDDEAEPARARLRWVRLGGAAGAAPDAPVEVLSGLSEGELYLVDPPPGLADGRAVEPRAAGPEPGEGP